MGAYDFSGGITNELVHTDKGDDTFRFLAHFIRIYLAGMTRMKRHVLASHLPQMPGWKPLYSSPEELVLFAGSEVVGNINDCELPPMTRGNCFGNAFRLALTDPSLRYHEGWGCMEGGMPTHHAWVVDAHGRVQDPTWLSVVRSPIGPAHIPHHNRNRCAYMGIHVPLTQHIGWFLEAGDVNLLARGEMVPPGLLERGMDVFTDHDTGEAGVEEDTRLAIIKILDTAKQWTFDPDTGVYHRDGVRWCGRRERFLEDGED